MILFEKIESNFDARFLSYFYLWFLPDQARQVLNQKYENWNLVLPDIRR